MRLVSDNPNVEQDKRAEWARRGITWPLRELTANLLRVARGAGKPYEVGYQASAVLEAFQEYREACGCYPSSWEIQVALSRRDNDDHWDSWEYGVEDMIKGGLQMAASQLLSQRPQEAAGRREMFHGLEMIEKVREENRRETRRPTKFTELKKGD